MAYGHPYFWPDSNWRACTTFQLQAARSGGWSSYTLRGSCTIEIPLDVEVSTPSLKNPGTSPKSSKRDLESGAKNPKGSGVLTASTAQPCEIHRFFKAEGFSHKKACWYRTKPLKCISMLASSQNPISAQAVPKNRIEYENIADPCALRELAPSATPGRCFTAPPWPFQSAPPCRRSTSQRRSERTPQRPAVPGHRERRRRAPVRRMRPMGGKSWLPQRGEPTGLQQTLGPKGKLE